jgi:hypothetical protein
MVQHGLRFALRTQVQAEMRFRGYKTSRHLSPGFAMHFCWLGGQSMNLTDLRESRELDDRLIMSR